jgi:hypothetical protein
MKTLVTYFRDNSTPEDYLFLLGFITMAATVIRAVMLLNNNLLSVQLSSFLRWGDERIGIELDAMGMFYWINRPTNGKSTNPSEVISSEGFVL